MVGSSGIRDKYRSDALKQLAKERSQKRTSSDNMKELQKLEEANEIESDMARLDQERESKRSKQSANSLLSMLPKPKNSSSFATVRLDKLMDMPDELIDEWSVNRAASPESPVSKVNENGMIEVDISKMIADGATSSIRDFTIEKARSDSVKVDSKVKEKSKNQITHLAKLAKASELSLKEKAAQGRANKAAARSKYGW